MPITIQTTQAPGLGRVLYAPGATFEQSTWLGQRGWWFYGRRSDAALAAKLNDAGVPLNTRWLPETKATVAAQVLGADGVEWSADARAVVEAPARAQEASRATDADIDVPAPAGLEYRPYQRAGIQFALDGFARGQRGVLLGDEMGLGKTVIAIATARMLDARRILVACPASLRINWMREIEKWWPEAGTPHVVNGGNPFPTAARVVILNYDKTVGRGGKPQSIRDALGFARWDLVILDEGHYLKNPDAQRTRVFFGHWTREGLRAEGVIHRADRVLLLTGTPIQNDVRESLGLCRAVGAVGDAPNAVAKSEVNFLFRFCNPVKSTIGRGRWAKTVTSFDGGSNLPELQARLRSGWMVRRLKKEVETELPPKLRSIVYLPCPDLDLLAVERELFTPDWASALADANDGRAHARSDGAVEGDDWSEFNIKVSRLTKGGPTSFEAISRYRAILAQAKAPFVVAHVRDLFETGEPNLKMLVFAHHHVLIDALVAEFGSACVSITGETPLDARQAAVDRFQTDATCTLAVLSTHAAGVGITMTAANHEVFAEADWNPAWCQQAEDRGHRIGQTAEKLPIQYLVIDGTLDAHVVARMARKLDIADRALDRRAPTTAAPASPPPAPPAAAKPATRKTTIQTRNDGEVAYTITDDVRAAVCDGLLRLAGHCDGARRRDDTGFNRYDARSPFVQRLVALAAAGGRLSDAQTAWALHTLRTYASTQLPDLKGRLYPEAA